MVTGRTIPTMASTHLYLSGDPDADALLGDDPLALLIGMVLDQQIPLERAFKSHYDLKERLGGRLDAEAIADMDPEALATVFAAKPALHRFPGSMAGRVQQVCRIVTDEHGGDAAAIWTSATDGKQLLSNLKVLPGFGVQKAKIFAALLGKQLGVRPTGWRQACAPFGDARTYFSIADIDSPATLAKVRLHKQKMKAEAKAKAPTPR